MKYKVMQAKSVSVAKHLSPRNLFFSVLDTEKSKIEVPIHLVSGEGCSLPPGCVSSHGGREEKEINSVCTWQKTWED